MPFGALLVIDGRIVSRAHNRQVQDNQYLAHAEAVCLGRHMRRRSGPLPSEAMLVATAAPCPMCSGTAIVAGIRTFLVGETVHYQGAAWLSRIAVVHVLDDQLCIDLVTEFCRLHPERWQRFSAG